MVPKKKTGSNLGWAFMHVQMSVYFLCIGMGKFHIGKTDRAYLKVVKHLPTSMGSSCIYSYIWHKFMHRFE